MTRTTKLIAAVFTAAASSSIAIGNVAAGEASRRWAYPLLIGGSITIAAILHLTGIMGKH